MDATQFDTRLAGLLGDSGGATYLPSMRSLAAMEAALGYSRYRPALRRMGTGLLASAAASGATAIQVVGGVWGAGSVLSLGQWPEAVEVVTVTGVATAFASGSEDIPVLTLTLPSPGLVNSHVAGAPISGVIGLGIVPGQDTYALPKDFFHVEQESFDLAVGAKSQVKRTSAFYDASYGVAANLSGVGYAGQSNWGNGYFGGQPIAGNPAYNPNGAPGGGVGSGSGGGVLYRFVTTGRPQLIISPAPNAAQTLDFYYFGCQTIASVPDADAGACLDFAKAKCLEAMASQYGSSGDYKEGITEYKGAVTGAGLLAQAERAMREFDRKIRLRPYGTSG